MGEILQVDKDGHLTLPRSIRDRYHLGDGSELRLTERPEGILLEPVVETQRYMPLDPPGVDLEVAQTAATMAEIPRVSLAEVSFSRRWQGHFRPVPKDDARYRALSEKYL
jgi:bifunctional DNA-binding transcriptional regulator/antitoxin component of YhaV-PrlF toxin-antitoxin module